jgi:DNA polymerase-3 subunit epsilon
MGTRIGRLQGEEADVKSLWRLFRRELHPAIKHNRELFARFERNKPLESYEFVSLDTELTGLNPRKDAIVSIGAVRIKNLQVVVGDNFFSYVHPKRSMPRDSTLIHQITPGQIENAPSLKTVLPDLVEFCHGSLLVGHFVSLDMSFLNRASKKLLGGGMKNPCVDTMRVAEAYQQFQRMSYYDQFDLGMSYNLTDLCKRYGLPLFDKHDALEDAMQTAFLFVFLVRRLRAVGCETLKDLHTAGRLARSMI